MLVDSKRCDRLIFKSNFRWYCGCVFDPGRQELPDRPTPRSAGSNNDTLAALRGLRTPLPSFPGSRLRRCGASGFRLSRRVARIGSTCQLLSERETMNTQEAKLVLEAALLTAEQPLSLSEMRRMFDDEINADTLRVLLDELRTDWSGRGVELVALASGWRFQSSAAMRPVPGPPESGKGAEIFARGARDAGDHCVPPAGHARRHRRDSWRDGLEPCDQDARGARLDRGHRPPRGAGPSRAVRDDASLP